MRCLGVGPLPRGTIWRGVLKRCSRAVSSLTFLLVYLRVPSERRQEVQTMCRQAREIATRLFLDNREIKVRKTPPLAPSLWDCLHCVVSPFLPGLNLR